MKKFLLLPLVLLVMGCGLSKNQLAAEQAYYQMFQNRQAVAQPLVDIKIADPKLPANIERIVVYSPSSDKMPEQYRQVDYGAKWVGLIGTAVSVAAPWAGAWGIVHEIGKMNVGGTSYTTSGTGNTVTTKTAGTILNDSTSVPTIVTQPEPKVVVVEQPAPIIVTVP
jgi:hypothetical protein